MRTRAHAVALLVWIAAGCGSTPQTTAAPGETASALGAIEAAGEPQLPITVEGADGRTVEVTDVSRLVVLQGNITEVVYELGLGENVVGRDVATTFAEAEDLPVVTEAHDVSAESVLSLHPTLVLADTDTGPSEALDQIRNVGVPVLVFERPTSVADIDGRIRTIATALGVADRGDELATATAIAIAGATDEVPADAEALRVAFLYMRGQAAVYLIGGRGSGADSMIEAAGAIDAGTEMGLDTAFTPITSEALVKAAPDVILMTTTGLESVGGIDGLVAIPGIAQTPAGQDRRVVTIEDGLLYSFGTRTPEALRELAAGLYGGPA